MTEGEVERWSDSEVEVMTWRCEGQRRVGQSLRDRRVM